MSESDVKDQLCKLLLEQAKKCETTSGGGLLLSIKAHIEGRQIYEGCDHLWQVADHLTTLLPRPGSDSPTGTVSGESPA